MPGMHISVLSEEVLKIFDPQPGKIYIDATMNGGGHTKAILERMNGKGKVIGIDWDCALIERLRNAHIQNLTLICENYARLRSIARQYHLDTIDGILFDLGFSTYHIEESQRGFSFLRDEPLDMRYHAKSHGTTAADIINTWRREAIENIFREYGEERFARRIADAVVRARVRKRIATSKEFAEIIRRSVPPPVRRLRIDPATKIFQALRIAVNRELENLSEGLAAGTELLSSGGKMIVISFHSLEDRIVKEFFRNQASHGSIRILTKKPASASYEEIRMNPRARSAHLRAFQKL